jgi:hypothetical protein
MDGQDWQDMTLILTFLRFPAIEGRSGALDSILRLLAQRRPPIAWHWQYEMAFA